MMTIHKTKKISTAVLFQNGDKLPSQKNKDSTIYYKSK